MPTPADSVLVTRDQSNSALATTKQPPPHSQQTRFVGKHSRDNRLSIFLNRRNSNTPEDLLGLVRINRDALHLIQEKGATVVVGVMARLLCDHGLQFSEHFVYQRETTIYPPAEAASCQEIELAQGILGDAVLPDEFHRGFRLKLPAALPPSCIFLSPDTSMGPGITGDSPWGLTYYLYAYLCTQPHHRKSSKVFLSFTRAIPSNPAQLVKETGPPVSTVSRASLVGTGKPLNLTAALDRSFFYTGDQMAVHVKIDNPRSVNFTGIRITLKQIITMRALNQGRQVIKVPLVTYEFKSVDQNGKFQRSNPVSPCAPKDFPFIIDTIRINLKPGHDFQHVAVESVLPRNSIKSLIMCPTFAQTYEMQDNPLKYFAVEYYMNVHVVMPWGSNLIAKLPFTVASRGVEDAPVSNNSSNLVLDDLSGGGNNEEDFEEKEKIFEEARSASETRKVREPEAGAVHVDFKIVKCDMERSLQLLETSRNTQYTRSAASGTFSQMRRTWVREFADAHHVLKSHLVQLDNLLEIIVTCSGEKYSPGFPVELVRSLKDRFVPLCAKFLREHFENDRAPVFEDALNQFLDTLELVLMKFHLLAGRESHSDAVEINLDDLFDVLQGRLRKELDKLTLVIPGLIEWRWLLEELFYKRTDSSVSETNSDPSSDVKMAQLFQSIHLRLTESFSDSQIDPQEIFNYSRLLFSPATTLASQACQDQYNYFKVAFLVYYGNYQEIFLAFDQNCSEKNLDLKELREKLKMLRGQLIQSMTK